MTPRRRLFDASSLSKEHPSFLTVGVLSIIALGLAAFWEILGAMCVPGKMFIAYGLFWTAVLLPFLLWRPSVLKIRIYMLFLAALIILHAVPWNSRKVFLRDFDKVRVGMTVEEVEAVMGKYIKGTGWPAGPSTTRQVLTEVGTGISMKTYESPTGELGIQDSVVYRHSNDGAFNSDWGIVRFQEGRVVWKDFMPD
jgi:hypothetical protein